MKTILLKAGLIFLLAVLTLGCTKESHFVGVNKTIITKKEDNKSFMGEYSEYQEYGHTQMCIKTFRENKESIFCNRIIMCTNIKSEIKPNGSGYVWAIDFVKEFCEDTD